MLDLPEPATVYGLLSTRDSRIRYVGQTTGLPEWRLKNHMQSAKTGKSGAVPEWIRNEIAAGHAVHMRVIVEAATLNETEVEVIEILRAAGYDLLNKRRGGGSIAGDRPCAKATIETRRKLSEKARGRTKSPETRAKISASVRERARMNARGGGVDATFNDAASVGLVLPRKHLTV
jgi:hypothetical protein